MKFAYMESAEQDTVILLIRVPSLIVAPTPEKHLNHDNIMNIC